MITGGLTARIGRKKSTEEEEGTQKIQSGPPKPNILSRFGTLSTGKRRDPNTVWPCPCKRFPGGLCAMQGALVCIARRSAPATTCVWFLESRAAPLNHQIVRDLSQWDSDESVTPATRLLLGPCTFFQEQAPALGCIQAVTASTFHCDLCSTHNIQVSRLSMSRFSNKHQRSPYATILSPTGNITIILLRSKIWAVINVSLRVRGSICAKSNSDVTLCTHCTGPTQTSIRAARFISCQLLPEAASCLPCQGQYQDILVKGCPATCPPQDVSFLSSLGLLITRQSTLQGLWLRSLRACLCCLGSSGLSGRACRPSSKNLAGCLLFPRLWSLALQQDLMFQSSGQVGRNLPAKVCQHRSNLLVGSGGGRSGGTDSAVSRAACSIFVLLKIFRENHIVTCCLGL